MADDGDRRSSRTDDAGSDDPGPAGAPGDGFRLRTFLNGSLALDVVVPIVAYQAMIHLFGVARVPALVLSGAFPAVNVARRYVRDRRVDPVGVIVLASILIGAALSVISGREKLT